MERIVMLESHKEPLESGHLHFVQGQFYNVEDPLRAALIAMGKAVPESEHASFKREQEKAEQAKLAEVLKVPEAPKVQPLSPEQIEALKVPPAPEIPALEVTNG